MTQEKAVGPYIVERRNGSWLIIDSRDGTTWTTLGGSQRAYQRALNLAREHNMEARRAKRLADRLTKVEEGELVAFEGAYAAAVREGGERAGPKCDANTGRWYCATHREGFANQLQKDIHIHDGKHRLAWVCFEHGVEVP